MEVGMILQNIFVSVTYLGYPKKINFDEIKNTNFKIIHANFYIFKWNYTIF